jgi:ribosomal protein S4
MYFTGGQFRNYFERPAQRRDQRTPLQQRTSPDSVVYRLGFGISRRQAGSWRAMATFMNGRKVNIPSYEVAVGEGSLFVKPGTQ